MGGRSRLVNRAILRTLSQHSSSSSSSPSTLPASGSGANAVREEVKSLGRAGGAILGSAVDESGARKAQWGAGWVFAAAGLVGMSGGAVGSLHTQAEEEPKASIVPEVARPASKPRVVFVLGGPGSGKGTQCAKIVDSYGFVHLSAGDLLRAEIKSGSPDGTMIQNMIKEGKIVPSSVTINLLKKAMAESNTDKFLIDGFPRNEENRADFEKVTGILPEFILFFDCPETELERRLLGRNEGRVDDNIETIRKRFKVFIESSLPVIDHYEKIGKARKIDATKSREEVFNAIDPLFRPFLETDLQRATEVLLKGIDSGDLSTYERFCDPGMTAFEPEASGHLVKGLDFHRFYFNKKVAGGNEAENFRQSTVTSPVVTLLDSNVGLVTYTRLVQDRSSSEVKAYNETRLWQRKKVNGQFEWKNVHFHRSLA
ncbi:adenylate kinase [Marchantia polymorpha subsp. ruderalis]|uniref:UMP-CMP kinase n=1 Tax=Marchantia polymorpha TaxID=3197 RepID=A0A2R6XDT9_MARPO|nr:hypothetical protein MARPO_0021s0126 [Marchantia polymorpha]BBN01346.1 hypothetical protein Mp_2g06730 [Marchantia polymorpha subsp. ruderalis]|eukprot:PTQ44272.1 hypothetical protein MARPO_0021s0126 [Marchantia polymorpha]